MKELINKLGVKNDIIIFIIILLLSVFFIQTSYSQNCTSQSAPYPNMGINMPGTGDIPWLNVWHCVNPWHSEIWGNGCNGVHLHLGPDGWPIANHTHRVAIGWDQTMGSVRIPGIYKVSFKGTLDQIGSFDFCSWKGSILTNCPTNFINLRSNYPRAGYSYFEIDLTNKAVADVNIEFNINGHIEDIKIMRPGYEISDSRILLPEYTNLLKNYTTLRFMPYLATNDFDASVDVINNPYGTMRHEFIDNLAEWNERTIPNFPQNCTGEKGGAWEHLIDLCNELDKDAWINIPVKASEDYILQLARLFKDRLKPSLNVNIELGNEIWNSAGGFHCFGKSKEMCSHYWRTGDTTKRKIFKNWGTGGYYTSPNIERPESFDIYPAMRRLPAHRLKEIIDIFASVYGWGEINNRIRAILAGQIGYGTGDGWFIGSGLEYLVHEYGTDAPKKYLYAVAAAPYFGPDGQFSDVNAILNGCQHNIDVTTFGEFSNHCDWGGGTICSGNYLEGWLREAGQYGIKLYAYEGGPDMDYTTGDGIQNPAKLAAATNPRMTELCNDYWNHWYSRYGYNSLFCFFLAAFNGGALYTLGEDMHQISTRQASMNYITTSPAPDFDTVVRNIIPGICDARKSGAYSSNWATFPDVGLRYPDWIDTKYIVAAKKNGKYNLRIRYNCYKNTPVDLYFDGVKVYSSLSFPNTSGVSTWSDTRGIVISLDISYGVHVMKIQAIPGTDIKILNYDFQLSSESAPFQPSAVSGDIAACLGSPKAKYQVEIDQSVCEYEWNVTSALNAGAKLYPPAGGGGAVRTGQGTNLIYLDWSGVPVGNYTMNVYGKNDAGNSPIRSFTVNVSVCGFTVTPSSICKDGTVTFTPQVANATSWEWNFGTGAQIQPPVGNPLIDPQNIATGAGPWIVKYTVPGNINARLTTRDAGGTTSMFNNPVLVGSVVGGTASANPATVNAGASSTIQLTGYNGYIIGWEYSTDNSNWTVISSVDLPLNTGTLGRSTYYRAIVKSDGCGEQRSSAALVTVNNPVNPGILSPASTTICGGSSGSLLTLSGNNGTIVRWESKAAIGSWTTIAGATSSSYTPTNVLETTSYRVVINISGTLYYSQQATITVGGTVVAGTASANPAQVCSGNTTILNLINATGNIQWQSSANGTTGWTNITNATSSTYTTAALTSAIYYRAIVGGGTCPSVNSNTVAITIGSAITVGTASVTPTQVCSGSTVNLNLAGSTGIIQWQQSANGTSGWTDINGATTANYTSAALTTATYFRAAVSGGGCPAVNSNSVSVTITPASVAGTASANPTQVCSGNTTILSLSGNIGTIQWQSSANGTSGWTNINGATSASYTSGALTTGIYYRAVVSSGTCTSANSNSVQITIGSAAVAGTIIGAADFCVGGTIPLLTLNGSNGTIQWQSSTDGINFTNINGATTLTYTPTSFTSSKWFRANVSQTGCGQATSASVKMDALSAPAGGSVTATNTTIAAGTSPGILTLSGNGGNVVKWQYAQTPFIPITWRDTIITSTSLTAPALFVPTRFRAVVNNGVCSDVYSNFVEITVVPYNGGAISGGATVCYGTSGNVLNLSGHNGTILKWQSSTDPLAGRTDIANTSGATTYTTPALYRTTWYWAVIQDINGQLFSTPDSIVVKSQPDAGTITASATNVAAGAVVNLNSGSITGNIIAWESRTMTGSWSVVPGSAGQSTLSSGNLTETTLFRMVVGNSPCANATSNELVINVFDVKVGTLSANTFDICAGTQVSLALNNSTGTVVSWENAAVIGTWGNIINTDTLYSATPSVTTYYRVKVRMPDNSEVYSNMVTISVSAPPVTGNLVYTPNVCAGNDAGIIRIENNTGTVSDWESSVDGLTWSSLSQTGSTYNSGIINTTTQYRVKLVNGVCPAILTTPAVINVLPGPRADLAVTGSTVCAGGNATVTVIAKQAGVKYSLQTLMGLAVVSTVDSSGVDVVFTLNNVSADASYSIMAGSSGCSALLTDNAKITVIPLTLPQFSGPADVCPNDTSVSYNVIQESNHIYSFTIDGGIITDQSVLSNVRVAWTQPTGIITVKDSSVMGCVTSKSINVIINDVQAPQIICKSDVIISTIMDSIQNDQFNYTEAQYELEPLQVSDNCVAYTLSNDINLLDTLKGNVFTFIIQDALEYTQAIKWTIQDRSGLSASCVTKIVLKVDADIEPFSAFSPNHDGTNDYWEIKNISKYPDATVQVFNRWGQIIYESHGPYEGNKWDGDNLPIDSYHYKITMNGKLLKRGIVTIVK